MSFVDCEMGGGFANRMSKYAFARAYAEKHGATLRTTPWKGEQVFDIEHPRMRIGELPVVDNINLEAWDGRVDIAIQGEAQHQRCLIYSRAEARRWFTLRPEIKALLEPVPKFEIAAHLRWGDFQDANGFIAISKDSYRKAVRDFKIGDEDGIRYISEEEPLLVPGVSEFKWRNRPTDEEPGLGFLPDWWALCLADNILRGPSTFSWWAAVLGDHKRVFSPWQQGIPWQGTGRGFQDVPFVEGNHAPITCWWAGHSELHLRET